MALVVWSVRLFFVTERSKAPNFVQTLFSMHIVISEGVPRKKSFLARTACKKANAEFGCSTRKKLKILATYLEFLNATMNILNAKYNYFDNLSRNFRHYWPKGTKNRVPNSYVVPRKKYFIWDFKYCHKHFNTKYNESQNVM